MKKKALMALITMLVVTSMSVAGNGSDKKDKRVVPPSPRGQLYKGLDLSEEQMTQMQKINRDFATERRQSFTKEKKEKMARKQEHVKKLRKELKYNSLSTNTDFTNQESQNIITAGVGVRLTSNLYLDMAYKYSGQNGQFYPFDDFELPPVKQTNNTHSFLATLGFRF